MTIETNNDIIILEGKTSREEVGIIGVKLDDELIVTYDKLYRDNVSIDYIDKKNIINEKNAVLLSRLYMLSQLTIGEFVYKSIYIKRKEFDLMWKTYKRVAIENNLRPTVENGNLIFNHTLRSQIRTVGDKFILKGERDE